MILKSIFFFFFFRPPDSKPMRPVRKRPAPEDFLGKGSNKKILMGKYVGSSFLYKISGFGLVNWFGGFYVWGFFLTLFFLYTNFQTYFGSKFLTLELPKNSQRIYHSFKTGSRLSFLITIFYRSL